MESVGLQKCDPIFLKKWINAKPALLVTILLNQSFMYTVYLLLCNDDTYYTGCTSNLEERLKKAENLISE